MPLIARRNIMPIALGLTLSTPALAAMAPVLPQARASDPREETVAIAEAVVSGIVIGSRGIFVIDGLGMWGGHCRLLAETAFAPVLERATDHPITLQDLIASTTLDALAAAAADECLLSATREMARMTLNHTPGYKMGAFAVEQPQITRDFHEYRRGLITDVLQVLPRQHPALYRVRGLGGDIIPALTLEGHPFRSTSALRAWQVKARHLLDA